MIVIGAVMAVKFSKTDARVGRLIFKNIQESCAGEASRMKNVISIYANTVSAGSFTAQAQDKI